MILYRQPLLCPLEPSMCLVLFHHNQVTGTRRLAAGVPTSQTGSSSRRKSLRGCARPWPDIVGPETSRIIPKHKPHKSDRYVVQKLQVVVQKMQGQIILHRCYVSQAREQRAVGCCKSAASRCMRSSYEKDAPTAIESWD